MKSLFKRDENTIKQEAVRIGAIGDISYSNDVIMSNLKQAANNINYNKNKVLKCASAFSGIGAFEEALKNTNVNHTNEYMIEIDKYARKTYLANHSVNNIYEDITK